MKVNDLKIAVHDGKFHADDVFACAILRLLNPNTEIIRTRNEELIGSADIRVDVGRKYNPETLDFDHHQKDSPVRENEIPYAAAGLIWKHFGRQLVSSDKAFTYIDECIMQEVDAVDNGVDIFETKNISVFTITKVIGDFNPGWQQKEISPDDAFNDAVNFAQGILKRRIVIAEGLEKAEQIMHEVIKNSHDKILVLDQFCPWKKIAITESDALYIVYPTSTGGYNVQTIPKSLESFEDRKSLPKKWSALEGQEFIDKSGVEDATFCHNHLFIAGAKSKKGALKLAEIAVANEE
ncbi:MAG: MYG1 family protein [Nanobdellota archaeon]